MISDDYDLLSAFLSAFRNEGGENPSVNFKLSVTGHYTDRAVPETMSTFRPTTTGEIAALLKKVPSKHGRLDPVPTWLVKQVSSVIAPVITNMCNASFDQRVLPASQKKAITVPLLKKPTLDSSDLNSFRPISNLSFVSKIVERVADSRFVEHVEKYSLFPVFQSAYRVHYSTETALVRLHNDMVSVIDNGEVGGLVLLDMSSAPTNDFRHIWRVISFILHYITLHSAFDTVDHQVMLDVLHRRFDVRDAALDWFRSYFSCLLYTSPSPRDGLLSRMPS